MNFFRLRFLNTILLFLAGIILGFILKDKFSPGTSPAAPAEAPGTYSEARQPPAVLEEEELQDEPYLEEEEEPQKVPGRGPVVLADREPETSAPEIVIAPQAGRSPAAAVVRADEASEFFSGPQRYAGREVELRLQMITAKKSASGWRLNLVYSGPGRKIDYLYVEDSEVLGDKPDLRIGYVYKVRFSCGKGDAASGNALLAIEHTGEKAEWATGLSAVE